MAEPAARNEAVVPPRNDKLILLGYLKKRLDPSIASDVLGNPAKAVFLASFGERFSNTSMGLNIVVYRFLGPAQDTYIEGRSIHFEDLEEVKDWDSFRYSGDNEFIATDDLLDYVDLDPDLPPEDSLWLSRPADFEATRQWVTSNIPKSGQPRFLSILDQMEVDPRLFFSFQ